MSRVVLVCTATAILLLALVPATSAARSCAPVVNPYPGTTYEGIDLSGIKAKGIGCKRARKVAKGAHRKGLALTPTPAGYLDYVWRGWEVFGNLRPASDTYTATRDGRRVSGASRKHPRKGARAAPAQRALTDDSSLCSTRPVKRGEPKKLKNGLVTFSYECADQPPAQG